MIIKSCSQRKNEFDFFFFYYKTQGFTKNNTVYLKIYFNYDTIFDS